MIIDAHNHLGKRKGVEILVDNFVASVPGPENGGYLVLFGSDLSIFCGENKTKWGG